MAGKDDYLGETLIDMGAVDPTQVDAARPAAEAAGAGVVDTLVVQKTLNPDFVVQARAMQARVEVVDLVTSVNSLSLTSMMASKTRLPPVP